MTEKLGKVPYKGKTYATLGLMIGGVYNCFAESALNDAMEENNDLCCDLDGEIVFYPTREQLEKMLEFKIADDYKGLEKFLKDNEIFYYKNIEGHLESGLDY